MNRSVIVGLAGLVLLGSGCASDRDNAPPGALSFDSQITLDGVGQPGAGPAEDEVAPTGVIVGHVVGRSITAHEGPSVDAPTVAELDNPTEVGGPLVLTLVAAELPTPGPDVWVEVRLPIRPNGTTGWVKLSELAVTRNNYRIDIDVGDHRLEVWRDGQLWMETTVAIGTGATPTPIGEFYIIELLQPPDPGGLYGPYAFGLSGFSETLRSFAGGDGVIGIHGTDEPDALGTDVSHGCVRVDNDVITRLAEVIPLGTPVVITD